MDNVYLIQKEYAKTIDGIMVKSIMDKFEKWMLDRHVIEEEEYSLLSRERLIPVGNIPFVQSFLEKKMKPIEVPDELRRFLKREYFICKGQDVPKEYLNNKYFFKDADTLKKWNNALNPYDLNLNDNTNYVVSERVQFDSEYRVFVHEDEILGVQHYLGDVLLFPEAEYIRDVVYNYNGPAAYTLDIGIHNGETDLIEIHPFACCGLYGFYDRDIIPMLKKGFEWYQNQ